MEFNTLEEAQEEIIRLNEEVQTLKTDNENYSTKVSSLEKDLENVREINQKYFLKLSAQYQPAQSETQDEDDVPTCEDFAKTLTI